MLRTIGIAFVGCLMSCACGAQQMSTVCQFTKGPAAGTTHDYAPLLPAPVGTPCHDGKGSSGYLIPIPANNQQSPPQSAGNAGPATSHGSSQGSTVCSFTQGPAAGTTRDYAPLDPLPIGAACNDGMGSTGTMIARTQDPSTGGGSAPATNSSAPQQMSTVCSFNQGPEAGTTHDYAPLDPLPVGSACNNGRGSTGTVIAQAPDPAPAAAAAPATNSSAPQQMSTLCSFNQGPRAGTTHDYAPLDPLPVGTSCNDGNGSTGTMIAKAQNPEPASTAPATTPTVHPQLSTVCSFNYGPEAGTTHDYAPLDPLPVGTACNDGKGSTGIITAKSQESASTTESPAAGSQETSTLCKFNAGPATGTTHDYAPLDSLPVGTACNDGAGSTGVIIARSTNPPPPTNTPSYGGPGPASTSPSSPSAEPSYAGMGKQQQKMSTVCKFTSGPAAGTLHDYAPLDPIPVGSACNDGKGSTGTIIPR